MYKYDDEACSFSAEKEVRVNQPVSCIAFTNHAVVFATDKFYTISCSRFTVSELLDKMDHSLAFAAFGAVQYNNHPIAVFPVSSSPHSAEQGSEKPGFFKKKPNPVGFFGGFIGFYWVFGTSRKNR